MCAIHGFAEVWSVGFLSVSFQTELIVKIEKKWAAGADDGCAAARIVGYNLRNLIPGLIQVCGSVMAT